MIEDVALGDFGTSKVLEGSTSNTAVVGTLEYIAPEVYWNAVIKRAEYDGFKADSMHSSGFHL